MNIMSIDIWMDKDVFIYLYIHTMEYYPAIKMNKIMPFAETWMQLEILSKSRRKTNTVWYHLMWNLKYGTNEHIYETEADSQT